MYGILMKSRKVQQVTPKSTCHTTVQQVRTCSEIQNLWDLRSGTRSRSWQVQGPCNYACLGQLLQGCFSYSLDAQSIKTRRQPYLVQRQIEDDVSSVPHVQWSILRLRCQRQRCCALQFVQLTMFPARPFPTLSILHSWKIALTP